MSKILILNAKGGVGKSTISMQVVVPYLYLRNEKSVVNYRFLSKICKKTNYSKKTFNGEI